MSGSLCKAGHICFALFNPLAEHQKKRHPIPEYISYVVNVCRYKKKRFWIVLKVVMGHVFRIFVMF